MNSLKLCSAAFEDLAQGLRVLSEAHARLHRGLLHVDRAEAVGNVESGLSSVLHAFHSLRDAVEKEIDANPVNWYTCADLATVLALRNARHHNKGNRIRTVYTYHTQEAASPVDLETYVFVDFASLEDDGDTIDVFLSWGDLYVLLSLPPEESMIRPSTRNAIWDYLDVDRFQVYARRFRVGRKRVFFNVTPLIVNAGSTIIPLIRDRVSTHSSEGEFFLDHFCTVKRLSTRTHEVHKRRFYLPA